MDISITEFRRHLFEYVNQAIRGTEVAVISKGRRILLTPEDAPGSRLSRITPLDLIEPHQPGDTSVSLQEEMARAWERDWSTL